MTQLTSITNLRNSSAMQSRVECVMRFLKQQNPAWQADWFFPIAIIRVSNGSDDCSWVRDHTSTHHKGDGSLYQGGHNTEAAKVIENLKGFQANGEDDFTKLNELLTSAFGANIDWAQGFGVGVAAAPTPFVPEAAKKPALQANGSPVKTRKSSAAPKPIATQPAKRTKLDDAKALFSDLTPKQKVELLAWAEEKVLASKPCMVEREKLATAAA